MLPFNPKEFLLFRKIIRTTDEHVIWDELHICPNSKSKSDEDIKNCYNEIHNHLSKKEIRKYNGSETIHYVFCYECFVYAFYKEKYGDKLLSSLEEIDEDFHLRISL